MTGGWGWGEWAGGFAADWSAKRKHPLEAFLHGECILRQCREWTALFPRFYPPSPSLSRPWSQGDVRSRSSAQADRAPPEGM